MRFQSFGKVIVKILVLIIRVKISAVLKIDRCNLTTDILSHEVRLAFVVCIMCTDKRPCVREREERQQCQHGNLIRPINIF